MYMDVLYAAGAWHGLLLQSFCISHIPVGQMRRSSECTGCTDRKLLRQLLLRCSTFLHPCRSPAFLALPSYRDVQVPRGQEAQERPTSAVQGRTNTAIAGCNGAALWVSRKLLLHCSTTYIRVGVHFLHFRRTGQGLFLQSYCISSFPGGQMCRCRGGRKPRSDPRPCESAAQER